MKRPVLISILALALAGCSKQESRQAERTPAAPIQVSTVTAAMQKLPNEFQATGTVRARTTSEVAARMMGYVREVRAKLGDRVTAGQVLITLDAQDVDSQIRRAEAAVDEARGAQPEVEGAVNAASAQLDLARATFTRMQDLLNKKSISNQEFDEASAKLKLAEANYAMARAKREQLAARIRQAEQAVQGAQITQGYATVTAPATGIVTAKSVEPGILVSPGTPLMTIEQSGALRLEAAVEESRLSSVRVGQTVPVEMEGFPPMNGRVSEIVPSVDPASRTFIAKIDLPESSRLRSGQFGRARFSLGSREALTLPPEAIVTQGQLQKVFVVDNGVAHTRMITTGQAGEQMTEILSGLAEGETVVSPVPPMFVDGAAVEVRR